MAAAGSTEALGAVGSTEALGAGSTEALAVVVSTGALVAVISTEVLVAVVFVGDSPGLAASGFMPASGPALPFAPGSRRAVSPVQPEQTFVPIGETSAQIDLILAVIERISVAIGSTSAATESISVVI